LPPLPSENLAAVAEAAPQRAAQVHARPGPRPLPPRAPLAGRPGHLADGLAHLLQLRSRQVREVLVPERLAGAVGEGGGERGRVLARILVARLAGGRRGGLAEGRRGELRTPEAAALAEGAQVEARQSLARLAPER